MKKLLLTLMLTVLLLTSCSPQLPDFELLESDDGCFLYISGGFLSAFKQEIASSDGFAFANVWLCTETGRAIEL